MGLRCKVMFLSWKPQGSNLISTDRRKERNLEFHYLFKTLVQKCEKETRISGLFFSANTWYIMSSEGSDVEEIVEFWG
jgi:hypothetical protein